MSDSMKVQEFLETIQVPKPYFPMHATRGESGAAVDDTILPTFDEGVDQAIVIGSQIAEFSQRVPAALRPLISNTFLLAQLASNKAIEGGGGTTEWYRRYIDVLSNIGWRLGPTEEGERVVFGSTLEVHKAIIPVIIAALGPAAATALIVKSVLEGLAAMDRNAPWITLFNRESQRANANQFQVSYADVSEGGVPEIKLACFKFDARLSITQVLFFKFSDTEATLSHSSASLSLDEAALAAGKAKIEELVADHVNGYLARIEI